MESEKISELKAKAPSSRVVGFLAGSVALLAVCFVIVVAVNAWSMQQNQQPECSPSSVSREHTENYNLGFTENGTNIEETIVLDKANEKEYIVARDSKTGDIQTVTTVDYRANQTTMYSTKGNLCLVAKGYLNGFEQTVEGFRTEKMGYNGNHVEMHFKIAGQIADTDEIPVEMTPYCTASNTYILKENGLGGRDKRQVTCTATTTACPWFCWRLFGPIGTHRVTGDAVYYYACWTSYVSTCPICNGTLSEYYVWK